MAKILVVDDDNMLCEMLTRKFRSMEHEVVCSLSLEEGVQAALVGAFDVVYLDVSLPDGNGLEALPSIRKAGSAPEVVIMTGKGDPDGAELAMKNGAWDYIEKPSSLNMMILPLVRALQYREAKMQVKPVVALKREGIVGSSQKMQACLDTVAQAAASDVNVLVSGASGTGKELIAWAIHNNSARAGKNFVVVDCASLTETLVESVLFGHARGAYTGADKAHEGLIRQANGGTLFLDEVGELTFSIQKSFLRVLQEHRFRPLGSNLEVTSDFRLVAATNRDLGRMVQDGNFRGDLLYRLQAFSIEMPLLRERAEDIPELSLYYMMKFCERYGMEIKGLSPELFEMLMTYEWPGNVRELAQALDRMIAAARYDSVLVPKHLPTHIRIHIARASVTRDENSEQETPESAAPAQKTADPDTSAPEAPGQGDSASSAEVNLPKWQDFRDDILTQGEKKYLQHLLALSGDSLKKACEISGMSRSRLYELLKKYQLTISA
ncbi:MAG: sigma-54 dependent transcriptional regulator [Deltaproteobacteria bacterium]|nr:sigma-54 dependent transcriptional regulator [Deltaproteobacteria bacterium]